MLGRCERRCRIGCSNSQLAWCTRSCLSSRWARMHMHTRTHTHTCMHANTYVYTCIHTHAHTQTYIYIYIYTYIHHTYKQAYIRTCIHTSVCIHVYRCSMPSPSESARRPKKSMRERLRYRDCEHVYMFTGNKTATYLVTISVCGTETVVTR